MQIDDRFTAFDWECVPRAPVPCRIDYGSAPFGNDVHCAATEFTERNMFCGGQIRKSDRTRAEALVMADEGSSRRYPEIKWYQDAIVVDFKNAVHMVYRAPRQY